MAGRRAAQSASQQPLAGRSGVFGAGALSTDPVAVSGSQRLVIEDFPDAVLARQLSPNGRVHWAVRKNAREKAAARIAGGCLLGGIRPVCVPVAITLRWVFPRAGRHDLDNLVATSKCFVDTLVRRGIVQEDSSEYVTRIRAEAVVERGRRALEIIIEPAVEARP